ncbi:2-dehydro-3-deoxy-6-phosphogalactonate aldolase [Solimicrobium silvestre]|uniref:2-keto-3-deoxy-6-phosphogluconate aldolase n=1 Tax=Solimicrobium silvestre TaxID=2099400 RepID=A0A2S9H093_9BURK|nr:2-dehydro-3-deoxy-6-phosphogalactonate aldolase [Solimicrobium silvestre]PRC93404.1 2-keto-3-deoxy-6-phosphogluconate aldolase [Solimicrobium silvestre]
MSNYTSRFTAAFSALPLVAILRGIHPSEVEAVAAALYAEGFRLIEVPLNSPQALDSIKLLRRCLPDDALVGAGTVLTTNAVVQVQDAGGTLIVMPHADLVVIAASKQAGMACVPGVTTLTEAFSAYFSGADALKLFPAELIPPVALKAMRAVLPPALPVMPVGGITTSNMAEYRQAGAQGFGLGSALFSSGMVATDVAKRGRLFADKWQQISNTEIS